MLLARLTAREVLAVAAELARDVTRALPAAARMASAARRLRARAAWAWHLTGCAWCARIEARDLPPLFLCPRGQEIGRRYHAADTTPDGGHGADCSCDGCDGGLS